MNPSHERKSASAFIRASHPDAREFLFSYEFEGREMDLRITARGWKEARAMVEAIKSTVKIDGYLGDKLRANNLVKGTQS